MDKIAIRERWVVSTTVLPKSALRKRSRCYWETRSNVKGQHALTQTDNQRQKYMKKTHLLLRILAVIGRYGSHLMIVMIFVTQNNFQNGPGISDCLLGFYPVLFLTKSSYPFGLHLASLLLLYVFIITSITCIFSELRKLKKKAEDKNDLKELGSICNALGQLLSQYGICATSTVVVFSFYFLTVFTVLFTFTQF